MLETGFLDPSFRVLLRESSRRREAALEEFRERIAGLLAIGLVLAVPLYGFVSSYRILAGRGVRGGGTQRRPAGIRAAPGESAAVLNRLETNELSPSDVRMVQARLKENGFDPGPIDGIAGKRTLAALNAYRQSVRLYPVLVVSRETIGALQHR